MNEAMINNMTADELRRHIEHAEGPVSPRVALRLEDLAREDAAEGSRDENANDPVDALERVYDSLESAVRAMVERERDACEHHEYTDGLADHDVSVPDQLAYESQRVHANQEALLNISLSAGEADQLASDIAAGRVPYELRPDTGLMSNCVLMMQASGESFHGLSVDTEPHLDALLDAAQALDYWQENPTDQVRDSVFEIPDLSTDGGEYGIMVDAPDAIAVVPELEALERALVDIRGLPGNYTFKKDGQHGEWTVTRDNELGEIVGQSESYNRAVLQAWRDLEDWQARHGEA